MKRGGGTLFLALAVMMVAGGLRSVAAEEGPAPIVDGGSVGSASASIIRASASTFGWWGRDTLTGDWGGLRSWLAERGITLKPRVSLFSQGLTSGAGGDGFEFGGKADLMLNTDLSKLGFWNGLSMNVHIEYNFGESVNQRGGTLIPVNTALQFPGIQGADRFDVSSFHFEQRLFGDTVSLKLGKINLIDLYAGKPFQGGAGIDSFWNLTFAAPPSGTVPAYLLAAMLSVRTEPATFGFWIYDPTSDVNKSVFEKPFYDGVTIRGSVEFNVTIAGRAGHQGFVATYSTKNGIDWGTLDDVPIGASSSVGIKNNRYYFGYTFNQYLYQSKANPKEGVGLFGQFGISDGNPNPLHWSGFVGVGGTGLIPGRSRDNWGVGYYYDAFSGELKDSGATAQKLRNEQGWETFYNLAVTPWLALGGDVQVINPAFAARTGVFAGLRTVIRF